MSDLIIIGGNLFEVDDDENFANTLASIFPGHRLMVIGRGGIHADQVDTAIDYLKKSYPQKNGATLFTELCADLVPLHLNKNKITIRMELNRIQLAIAADELLQKLLPKNRIQFTGLHLTEVRNILRLRGEIWRIAPAPVEENDFSNIICHCRTNIGTGIQYLHNRHTGEHVLTNEEFLKIRPLLRNDKKEAIARLKEIVHLNNQLNNQGYPEIVFLLPSDKKLNISVLYDILRMLEATAFPEDMDKVEMLFDQFSGLFSAQAGPGLTSDNPKSSQWRAITLCRLYNIDEKTTAEWALGLGPEFYLNIRWLPGARISGQNLLYEPDVNSRVKCLIKYYRQTRNDFISINLGCILCPLIERDHTGEEREVYIVTLGLPDDRKDIRHVRMSKWGVEHRLKKGSQIEQAINETKGYRDYIIDRLTAARALLLPVPIFKEIKLEDELDMNTIPVYYFEREYVPGIVTNRIPSELYSRSGFLGRLAKLLGAAAAASIVLGRADPKTNELYFDDGDEVIQLSESGLPVRVIMIETTGSFADWTTPMNKTLPHCLTHLALHMEKASTQGIAEEELSTAVDQFSNGLIAEIQRMKDLLCEPNSVLTSLFSDRTTEPKGIRNRWEGILRRLKTTDLDEIKKIITDEYPQNIA